MSSCYVIIRGALGVGKTTISKLLAQKLDAIYISIDDVLAEHNLDMSSDGNGISSENFIRANKIALPSLNAGLTNNRFVVIDGNFYDTKQLEHLQKSLKGKGYIFTLQASLETCVARDAGRTVPHGRDAASAVYAMVGRLQVGTPINAENKAIGEILEAIVTNMQIN